MARNKRFRQLSVREYTGVRVFVIAQKYDPKIKEILHNMGAVYHPETFPGSRHWWPGGWWSLTFSLRHAAAILKFGIDYKYDIRPEVIEECDRLLANAPSPSK
jgi:hypothetical protein